MMTISNLNQSKNPNLFLDNLNVIKRNGAIENFDMSKFKKFIYRSSINTAINKDFLIKEIRKNFFNKMTTADIEKLSILASASMIELDTDYDVVACRMILQTNYKEVLQKSESLEFNKYLKIAFIDGINQGLFNDILDSRMAQFDLNFLSSNIDFTRDNIFNYIAVHFPIIRRAYIFFYKTLKLFGIFFFIFFFK